MADAVKRGLKQVKRLEAVLSEPPSRDEEMDVHAIVALVPILRNPKLIERAAKAIAQCLRGEGRVILVYTSKSKDDALSLAEHLERLTSKKPDCKPAAESEWAEKVLDEASKLRQPLIIAIGEVPKPVLLKLVEKTSSDVHLAVVKWSLEDHSPTCSSSLSRLINGEPATIQGREKLEMKVVMVS